MTSRSQITINPLTKVPPVQTSSPHQSSITKGITISTNLGKITLAPKSITSITIDSSLPLALLSTSATTTSTIITTRTRSPSSCSSSSSSQDSVSSYASSSGLSSNYDEEEEEEEEQAPPKQEEEDVNRTSLLHHLISGPASYDQGVSSLSFTTENMHKPRQKNRSTQSRRAVQTQRRTQASNGVTSRSRATYHPSPWGNDPRPRDVDLVQKAKSNVVSWLKNWRKSREALEFEERLKSWDEMKKREGGWY